MYGDWPVTAQTSFRVNHSRTDECSYNIIMYVPGLWATSTDFFFCFQVRSIKHHKWRGTKNTFIVNLKETYKKKKKKDFMYLASNPRHTKLIISFFNLFLNKFFKRDKVSKVLPDFQRLIQL